MPDKIIPFNKRRASRKAGNRVLPGHDTLYEHALSKLLNGLQYPRDLIKRLAEVLADDPEVNQALNMFILAAVQRMSKQDQRSIHAYVEQLISEEDNS